MIRWRHTQKSGRSRADKAQINYGSCQKDIGDPAEIAGQSHDPLHCAPARTGRKITRALFGWEEEEKKKLEAYELIDQAPRGTRFLRVTISPDPKKEDTHRDLNLIEMTRVTMQTLQSRFKGQDIAFFAAIHAGHTDKRHVNLLVLFPPGNLTKHHWAALREAATQNAKEQRLLLDHERSPSLDRASFPLQARRKITKPRMAGRSLQDTSFGGSASKAPPVCPVCKGPLTRQGQNLTCDTCQATLRGAGIDLEIRYQNEFSFEPDEEEEWVR